MSDALAEPMTDADITALIELFDRARLLSAPTSGLASAAVHALRQQREEISRLRAVVKAGETTNKTIYLPDGTTDISMAAAGPIGFNGTFYKEYPRLILPDGTKSVRLIFCRPQTQETS